jgi:hypothetical protein
MTDPGDLFRRWLETGTDAQKLHAAHALAAREGRPAPEPEPEPRPACPYRESCACTGGAPVCYHPTNGPRFGAPSTLTTAEGPPLAVRRVTTEACIRCQSMTPEP